jgi:hypothetical protein
MNRADIEQKVNVLHRQLGVLKAQDPVKSLAPRKVIEVLGYEFQEVPSLDWPPGNNATSYGGQIDQQARQIAVATRFSPAIQRFTALHEVGHLILHGDYANTRLHRDIPLSGEQRSRSRPRIEREADSFAGFYLIPRILLHQHMELRFGLATLAGFNWEKALAFHLAPSRHHSLLADGRNGKRARSLAIANASNLGGTNFKSLAETFRVSPAAMAIQLEITGLVT